MFHEASSMQVISCAGLVSLFRPSMFPQHPGGSSRDTRCLMLSHASAVQQSSWVNLYSSTVWHRGRARGIWRHTSASGKEPRNGCKLALAMPYCSVGFGGLLAGPRACDAWSKSCEEALYRWNWNRNQLEGRPRHRSNPQAVGRNAAAAATTGAVQDLGDGVSLVALLLSTAVLIRSLVCKPLSENSDDGIADVEAGMLPTDHAAVVSMMQPCSFWMWPEMEAACKTWSAVPVIPNAPVVCLNRRWQTCWRYTTRPRRGCTTLPATSCRVCMQRTVCRPPLSGRLCRLAWERWLQICHIPSTRPSCSTARAARWRTHIAQFGFDARICDGLYGSAAYCKAHDYSEIHDSLGMRTLIVSRVLLGRVQYTSSGRLDIKRPAQIPRSPEGLLHGSVVSNKGGAGSMQVVPHREMMVYENMAALPMYLVSYRLPGEFSDSDSEGADGGLSDWEDECRSDLLIQAPALVNTCATLSPRSAVAVVCNKIPLLAAPTRNATTTPNRSAKG